GPADRPRIVPRLGLVALGVLLWARCLVFPDTVASDSLDASWMQALSYFYANNFRAGVDYVFTYGPLGSFLTRAYDPALYWQRYAWELVVKGVAVAVVLLALAPLRPRVLWPFAAVVLILLLPAHADCLYFAGVLAAGILLLDAASRGARWGLVL